MLQGLLEHSPNRLFEHLENNDLFPCYLSRTGARLYYKVDLNPAILLLESKHVAAHIHQKVILFPQYKNYRVSAACCFVDLSKENPNNQVKSSGPAFSQICKMPRGALYLYFCSVLPTTLTHSMSFATAKHFPGCKGFSSRHDNTGFLPSQMLLPGPNKQLIIKSAKMLFEEQE